MHSCNLDLDLRCGPVPRDTVGSVVSCPSMEPLFEGTPEPERPPSSSRLGVSIATRPDPCVCTLRQRKRRKGLLQRVVCNVHLLTVPLSAQAGRGHTDTVQYETTRVRAALPCTGFRTQRSSMLANKAGRDGTGRWKRVKGQGLTYSTRQSLPRRYAQSTHTPLSESQRSSSRPVRADTVRCGC